MDTKGVIRTGFLGQDGAINAGYYYYVLQTLPYQIIEEANGFPLHRYLFHRILYG
jgi:hypothetical protein